MAILSPDWATQATDSLVQSKTMPQKPVFFRSPIVSLSGCFLSNGLIRTDDQRIRKLYQKASVFIEEPEMWEGLFRIACLLHPDPLSEPVAGMIQRSLTEQTENGSFEGTARRQIGIARAAYALFEYNTDRTVLKQLAGWFRYLEIEFDRIAAGSDLLYRAADLMELLVRFYLTTGLKPVLRLCARLRAASFDWTSALHTFQQSIPVSIDGQELFRAVQGCIPEELDYDLRNQMINHAGFLSDGIRFTAFAGLFSGNGMDLSAGKTVWQYLRKHHYAICGGTTSAPELSGKGADKPVSTETVASWTEAFASQMLLEDASWAHDEMVRIVFNALDYCLNREGIKADQRVNQGCGSNEAPADPAAVYARLTKAAAAAFRNAVTQTKDGIRINYLMPARYVMSIGDQTVVLRTDEDGAAFICEKPFDADVAVYVASTETARICIGGETVSHQPDSSGKKTGHGYFIHAARKWQPRDAIRFEQEDRVYCEETHHQGICCFVRNRLMAVPFNKGDALFAVTEPAECRDGILRFSLKHTDEWKQTDGQPRDIPVRPSVTGKAYYVAAQPYSTGEGHISMLPRGKRL